MKQSALAAITGLSEATISQLESGRQGYTRSSLEALARALDTRPGYLLEFDPLEDPAFWQAWLSLTHEDQERLAASLRETAAVRFF